MPGILRWAMDGCLAWQRQGLGMPDEVRLATATYRAEMDLLGDFIREKCMVEAGSRIAAGSLYEAYTAWAHTAGEKPITKKAFGMQLTERGFAQGRTERERLWVGLRLATPTDPDDASDRLTHS